MGLPGTVLGIPGYLVSRDPWDPMPGGTTRDCSGYPGVLSISGSMGPHAWWDYLGQSWVSRDPWDPMPVGTTDDSPGYPGILSTMGMILGCPMYPGMCRVVLGQTVAVLDIPRAPVQRYGAGACTRDVCAISLGTV